MYDKIFFNFFLMTAFSLSWSMGVLCKITGSEAQTSRDGGGGGGRDVNKRSASQGVGVALNSAPSHPLLTLATRRCSVARKSHAEALFTPHAFFFVSYPSLPGQCFAPPPPPPLPLETVASHHQRQCHQVVSSHHPPARGGVRDQPGDS